MPSSWMAYAWVDPLDQLQQLSDALLEAEEAGDKVLLLSHIPTNTHSCLGAWGRFA